MKTPFFQSSITALICLALLECTASANVETVAESPSPGPTVLIINKPASDEVSGEFALRQIACWKLTRGKVVTATEKEASEAIRSTSPAAVLVFETIKKDGRELTASTFSNRGAPGAGLLPKLNALLDSGTEPMTTAGEESLLPELNKATPLMKLCFGIKSGGITLAERVRMFRHATHEILTAAGMTTSSPWVIINPTSKKIKTAIYAGGGTSINKNLSGYPASLDRAADEFDYTYVGPAELVQPKVLDAFDVIIVGGGGASSEAKAMGEAGAAAIKDFIQRGGGYVSSCAGTYLATCNYDWSLKIIDADTVDSAHWARGSGQVDIELTSEGRKILGDFKGLQSCRYANGPLLAKAKQSGGLPPYTVLAWYRSDMAKGKNSPKGLMPNTPAVIAAQYGQGRILCCSPHPEYTLDLKSMVPRAVKWAAKRPVE